MDYCRILEAASRIEVLVRQGYGKDVIKSRVRGFSEEAFTVAKARIKNSKEMKIDDGFMFTEADLRFCTNRHVAGYRASRLKCGKIVDIGCGIGIQAIAFANVCGRVVAIDTDYRKLDYAKANAEFAGVENIEFMHADAIDALVKLKKADVVFWDPERPEGESERSLDSLKPSFEELLSAARKITESVVVELPPQIGRSKLKQDCEFEYISVDGKLNRLCVYFGKLKRCEVSVVALPSGERLEYGAVAAKAARSEKFSDYLYEIDPAMVKAGVVESFVFSIKGASIVEFGCKSYITSGQLVKSAFLKPYKVLAALPVDDVKDFLVKKRFGRAVPHGSIDEKRYSLLRRKLESGLQGDASAHVFIAGENAVVAERI
jgi:hypothetical protein